MKYLVDANVLSEPTKPTPDPRVVAWLRVHEADIAVDPVILGELRFGFLILPKGRKRTALERWEPRIDLEDVLVHLHAAEQGVLYIEIVYRLRRTNDPRNLVFPFYVIPATEGVQ